MDPNLTAEEKDQMLKAFDQNQKNILNALQREQEEQDKRLQQRMNARKFKNNSQKQKADDAIESKQIEIQEVNDQIDKITGEKDDVEKEFGAKKMKKEREEEFNREMEKFDTEKEKKINDLRNDYMDRIKGTKDPQEK